MKTCPQCRSVFPDDYIFCMTDGTTLKEDLEEQETVLQPKIKLGQTSALSPDMLIACPNCNLANRATSKFCKKCGANLHGIADSGEQQQNISPFNFSRLEIKPVEPLGNTGFSGAHQPLPADGETVAFQTPNFNRENSLSGEIRHTPATKANKFPVNKILIVGVLLGIIIAGGIFLLLSRPHPAEAKLDKAISNNKLLEPSGDNAYEFYQELKKDGFEAKGLKKYEDRLFPLLTEKPEEVLKTVTEPGITEKRLEEWQNGAKLLEWASEIRPQDTEIAAKAAYFKGRINYLTDQKDAAIEDWKKAADADKKWALPLNGVGLIYNERKDYETARKWLRQAIEREPNWAVPYNNFGSSYYFQKRYSEALPYYQKAVELAPRWARPHAWLASIALETGDCATAVREFETVLAPDAVGASEMNMDGIRKKYQEAKNCNWTYYDGY